MKNTNSNFTNANLMAVFSAVIILVGICLPAIRADMFLLAVDVKVMDHQYGWVILVLAVIGIISGLLDLNALTFFSGSSALSAFLYGYFDLTKGYDPYSNELLKHVLVRQPGFYVVIAGAAFLMLSSMFTRAEE